MTQKVATMPKWVYGGHMVRRVLALALAAAALGAAPAMAQTPITATVTNVVDGDTLDSQLSNGSVVRVQLIGIDAPEPSDCAGEHATAYLKQLALGRTVNLVTDPTQGPVDRFGRSLYYVDRDDGLDVGQEMLRAGWAGVFVFERDFQRLPASGCRRRSFARRSRQPRWSSTPNWPAPTV